MVGGGEAALLEDLVSLVDGDEKGGEDSGDDAGQQAQAHRPAVGRPAAGGTGLEDFTDRARTRGMRLSEDAHT